MFFQFFAEKRKSHPSTNLFVAGLTIRIQPVFNFTRLSTRPEINPGLHPLPLGALRPPVLMYTHCSRGFCRGGSACPTSGEIHGALCACVVTALIRAANLLNV